MSKLDFSQQINDRNIKTVRDQIYLKQQSKPYYGSESTAIKILNDMDNFPYKRFYRGVEFESKATERVLLSIYTVDAKSDSIIQIIRSSGKTVEADDSYLAVFHANEAYKLKGGDQDDQLIKIM